MAAEQVEAVQPAGAEVEEVVADKGYHSDASRIGVAVTSRSRSGAALFGEACCAEGTNGNRRRIRGDRGRRLQRRRGELVERPFAHRYETGGLRRVWVRGHENVRRVLIQAAGCNLGLLLSFGTPRSLQGRALSAMRTDRSPDRALGAERVGNRLNRSSPRPEQAGSANRLLPG